MENYISSLFKTTLPEVLTIDKFRSHASSEDKMSFICTDGKTGKLMDIFPSRKLAKLTNYFKPYSHPNQVKFLAPDMNTAYFQLTKSVFKSAKELAKTLDFDFIRNSKASYTMKKVLETH